MNTYHFYKLSNGLPVILVPTQGTSVAIFVYVRVGSRHESAPDAGLAHFIEHLHFKGTQKRPTYMEINRDFDELGAEYNAFTGKEETGYYIKCAHDRADDAMEILSDMLFHSRFPEEEFDREKKVILEELKMYHDNPRMHLPHLLDATAFGAHPLGRDIVGTEKTLVSFTRSRLMDFHRRHYHPKNMVIAVAGNISSRMSRTLIDRHFGLMSGRGDVRRIVVTPFPGFRFRTQVKRSASDQVNLGISFPGLGDHVARQTHTTLGVLSSILGGGVSSRLFTELREKRGLCYSVGTSLDTYRETGTVQIFAGLDRRRLPEALDVTFDQIRSLIDRGVTDEELLRVKKNLRGKFLLALEDTAEVAHTYAAGYLAHGTSETPRDALARLERVTRYGLHRMAKQIFSSDRWSLALIGNVPTGTTFRQLIARFRSS